MTSFAPALSFAFEIRARVAPSLDVARGGPVTEFTPITGGTVAGPRLTGTVLAGGGDWSSTSRADGVCRLEARYLIRADDGAVIDIVNRGFYRPDAGTAAQRDGDLTVAADGLYFRTSPVFHTDAPAHRWLAETVFVGLARDEDDVIAIRLYAVE
ncbi:DUF3237 domain-containing protein [Actinomadura parmotrematis]|uniref:UPF0311 protein K1Y72_31220 n=1 Tax=Actinomadura parmotrematis TaxID=2864039 RepID=A0ABS7G2D2_9ACTN|nr:DUF3237 domain-containing protein [Actinomadura parmotrematis]MBW8486877.1 DUF3237 domain-containing protein [Actinomadura parmotrematis]